VKKDMVEFGLDQVRWRGLVCRNRSTRASMDNGRNTEMMIMMMMRQCFVYIPGTLNLTICYWTPTDLSR